MLAVLVDVLGEVVIRGELLLGEDVVIPYCLDPYKVAVVRKPVELQGRCVCRCEYVCARVCVSASDLESELASEGERVCV